MIATVAPAIISPTRSFLTLYWGSHERIGRRDTIIDLIRLDEHLRLFLTLFTNLSFNPVENKNEILIAFVNN